MSFFTTAKIETQITINAPPKKVREAFSDFENLSKWNDKFITNLILTRPGSDKPLRGIEAQSGDKIKLLSKAVGEYDNEIFVNEPGKYGWLAPHNATLGVTPKHYFEFLPSPESDDKTLFKHEETFEGRLACLAWRFSPIGIWLRSLFLSINQTLKNSVEDMAG